MKNISRLLPSRLNRPLFCALAVLSVLSAARAQTVVFNDTFGRGSSINSNPTSPAAPLVNKTAYQQLSVKTFNPNPAPTPVAGHLRYGSVSTSSGFNSLEALFTQYPVTLSNTGDYIEMTVVFTNEANLMNAANGTLFFGLYNASQVQPIPGGMNATANTATAGYAQNWQGYLSRILYSGSTHFLFARPAQPADTTNNQDLLYQFASGTNLGQTSTPVVAAFTTGQQYTEVFRLTKANATSLTVLSTLYQGGDTSGTQLFTQTATTSSILTATFDALAFGYRPVNGASVMDVNSLKVVTNATTTIVPVISQQPLSQTVAVGDPASFSVAASGGGAALSYQWKKGTADIDGQTGSSYTIPSVSLDDAADYTVVVTDVAGATTSNPATLTVSVGAVAPQITLHPANATILVGGSNTFSASFTGTAPVAAKWQKSTDGGANYTDIPGATTSSSPASYTITNAQLSNAGLFHLVATNGQGTATSNAATLAVNQAPGITSQPLGGLFTPGSSQSLTVTASGSPAPTYQWQKTIDGLNFTNVGGGTGASLPLTMSSSNSGFYRVVATNSVSTATSSLVYAGIASTTLGASPTFSPANNAIGVNRDTPLVITFSGPPIIGSAGPNTDIDPGPATDIATGRVRIFDADTDTVVANATLDVSTMKTVGLTANSATYGIYHYISKTIGGDSYYSTPIISLANQPAPTLLSMTPSINTNSAIISLPSSTTLSYNKTYYVKIDPGVFVDSNGAAYEIKDSTTWRFTTKPAASAPTTGTTALTVANDGNASDFSTVQGALDFIAGYTSLPNSEATRVTVTARAGIYYEQVHLKTPFVTLQGASRTGTVIAWLANNNVINAPGSPNVNLNVRNVLRANASDLMLQNFSIYNLTPQGGSQAEAFRGSGQRIRVNNMDLYSYQDTYLSDGATFVYNTYIIGDVDFLWGTGPSYFKNTALKMARATGGFYAQVRNPVGNHGFVFANCAFTGVAGQSNGNWLNRIDPTGFPYCEVVLLNCTVTNDILYNTVAQVSTDYNAGWWKMNGSTSSTAAPNAHLWDYNTKDQNGNTLTNPGTAAPGGYVKTLASPADDTTIANYGTYSYVLNGWTPIIAAAIQTQPVSQVVNPGANVTFTAAATGVPDVTYQWKKNGNPINGATGASYNIPSATGASWGSYTVTVTSAGSPTVTSSAATLTFSDPQTNYVASYGLDPSATGAPTEDPDGDGMNNKMEFFLGGNPTRADAPTQLMTAKPASSGPAALVIEFNRLKAAASVPYTVQYSFDLTGTWNTATHGVNGVTIVTTSLDSNFDHVAATIPTTETKAFGRLNLP